MATKSILVSDLTGRPITAADRPLILRYIGGGDSTRSFSVSTIKEDAVQKRHVLKDFASSELVLTADDLVSLLGLELRTDRDRQRDKDEHDRMYENNLSW